MAKESPDVVEKAAGPVTSSTAEAVTPELKTTEKPKPDTSSKETGGEKTAGPEKARTAATKVAGTPAQKGNETKNNPETIAAAANKAAERQQKNTEARTPNEHKGFFSKLGERWNKMGWKKKLAIGAGLMVLTLGGAAAGSTLVMGAGWLGGRILSGLGMYSTIDAATKNLLKNNWARAGAAALGGTIYAAFVPKIFSTLDTHLDLTGKMTGAIDLSKQAGVAAGDTLNAVSKETGRLVDDYGPKVVRGLERASDLAKEVTDKYAPIVTEKLGVAAHSLGSAAGAAGEQLQQGFEKGGEYLAQGAGAAHDFFSPTAQMNSTLYPVYEMQSGDTIEKVLAERFPDVQGLSGPAQANRINEIVSLMRAEGMPMSGGELDLAKVHALVESSPMSIPGGATEGVISHIEQTMGTRDFDKRLGNFLFGNSIILENLPPNTANEPFIDVLQAGNPELRNLSTGLRETLLDLVHDAKGKPGYDELVSMVGYKNGLLGESLGATIGGAKTGEQPLKSVLAGVTQWKLANGL